MALSPMSVDNPLDNFVAAGIALSYNVYGWQRN